MQFQEIDHVESADQLCFDQLDQALDKQKIYGGRINYEELATKVDAGAVTEGDWSFEFIPKQPETIEQTGLHPNFLADLTLKHALAEKQFTIPLLSKVVKLNQAIVAHCIDRLRDDKLVEIRSTNKSLSMINAEYRITEAGISRAAYLLEENRYVGPAPIQLSDYNLAVELQTIRRMVIDEETMKRSFGDIVIAKEKLRTLGAAVNSGKPIFIYGPSGNGKSTIAKAVGDAIPGEIFVPHAIMAGGQIISVFDEINHRVVESGAETSIYDPRWVRVKRPVIFAGGELTLKSLDLQFNETTKYYEAPLQVKANNGVFVVDDLGRQLIDPQILLNRWIVPLERRADFLTLSTGLKFEIPFDQVVIFATNISPHELADEAFLRRLRYKILVDSPSLEEYHKIFSSICSHHKIRFDKEAFSHLLMNYKKHNLKLNGCHPRDLIDHIIDEAYFLDQTPALTPEAIDKAWGNYFCNHAI